MTKESEHKTIARATGVLALATGLSRIAGLVRDVVVAALFGAGYASDAFFVAFTIPNLLRRFFAEGSLTAAFVPTFAEVYHHDGADAARQVVRICWTLLALVLIGVTVLGLLASPLIVKTIGYGFVDVPGKLQLTDLLNRVMFPYILFVSLVALFAGVLNVSGHFLMPALSPVLLNLSMIGCALVLAPRFEQPVFALAVGVLIGGVLQLAMQVPVLYRKGYDLKPSFNFSHPTVKRIAWLMVPGIAGVAIYQVNVVVTRLLATFLGEGSVSWLYYGQRLFEFPQGVFVVSLAQAVLPSMSRQIAADDQAGFRDSLRFALVLILLVTIPAAVGLVLCAIPVYSLFFMGGAFGEFDVKQSAYALACYAPGLLFVGISRVVAPTFYSLKDTRTPVWVSFWTLLVNAVAGLILMQFLGHLGLALALTVASAFNAVMLSVLLSARLRGLELGRLMMVGVRLVPGLVLMGGTVYLIISQINWLVPGSMFVRLPLLAAAVASGMIVYGACCWCLGVAEVRSSMTYLKNRVIRKGGVDANR